jgi:hypothetical protein
LPPLLSFEILSNENNLGFETPTQIFKKPKTHPPKNISRKRRRSPTPTRTLISLSHTHTLPPPLFFVFSCDSKKIKASICVLFLAACD